MTRYTVSFLSTASSTILIEMFIQLLNYFAFYLMWEIKDWAIVGHLSRSVLGFLSSGTTEACLDYSGTLLCPRDLLTISVRGRMRMFKYFFWMIVGRGSSWYDFKFPFLINFFKGSLIIRWKDEFLEHMTLKQFVMYFFFIGNLPTIFLFFSVKNSANWSSRSFGSLYVGRMYAAIFLIKKCRRHVEKSFVVACILLNVPLVELLLCDCLCLHLFFQLLLVPG